MARSSAPLTSTASSAQAHPGIGQPLRDHPHRPQPGHRRAHGAYGRRCRTLLGALTGVDPRDPATRIQPGAVSTNDYTRFLVPAVYKASHWHRPQLFRNFSRTSTWSWSGASLTMRDPGPDWSIRSKFANVKEIGPTEGEVLHYEFKADLNAYLGRLGPERRGPLFERGHRVQRKQQPAGHALLRPGTHAQSARQRPAQRRQVHKGA